MGMTRAKTLLLACGLVAALPTRALATEPDFYLVMQNCKIAVGYLSLTEESLNVIDGDPATSACFRQPGAVPCAFAFEAGAEGHKGNSADYTVLSDSPPMLFLTDENGSEFVSINTTKRAAVVVTRLAAHEYAGSKVCHGLYATASDLEALKEEE